MAITEQRSPIFLAAGTCFVEESFSTDGKGWFQDDSSSLHLLCTLFLLLLHTLHPRSSGIRSRRLGTPAVEDSNIGLICFPDHLIH